MKTKTHPNQKFICAKGQLHGDNNYTIIDNTIWNNACKDLNRGAGYIVWEYLCQYVYINDKTKNFAIFPADIASKFGGQPNTYSKAIGELIEKGYLLEISPNHFAFYPSPQQTAPQQDLASSQPEISQPEAIPQPEEKSLEEKIPEDNSTELSIDLLDEDIDNFDLNDLSSLTSKSAPQPKKVKSNNIEIEIPMMWFGNKKIPDTTKIMELMDSSTGDIQIAYKDYLNKMGYVI